MRRTCSRFLRTLPMALALAALIGGRQPQAQVSTEGRRGRILRAVPPPASVGRLTGTVRDTGGGALPGITLILSGPGLSKPRKAVTDEKGRFQFSQMPVGTFEMTCTAPGFVPWRREGIQVTSDTPPLNIRMRRARVMAAPPSRDPVPRKKPRRGKEPRQKRAERERMPRKAAEEERAAKAKADQEAPEEAADPGQASSGGAISPEAPAGEPAPPAHELLDEIDRFLAQLDIGSIAFNAPGELRVGETREMRLLLSPTLAIEDLQRKLEDLPGELEGAEIKIAPRMEAVLTGQNFHITAITPATQAVSRVEPTEWRWEVSSSSPGTHRLHLVLNATVLGTARTLRTFDRTIAVNVTIPQRLSGFVQRNWRWLWTAALLPLAGWIWRRRKSSQRREGAPAPDGDSPKP